MANNHYYSDNGIKKSHVPLFAHLSYLFCLMAVFLSNFWLRPEGSWQVCDIFFGASLIALLPGLLVGRVSLVAPWWLLLSGLLLVLGFLIRAISGGSYLYADFLETLQILFSIHIVTTVLINQQLTTSRGITLLFIAFLFGALINAVIAVLQSKGTSIPSIQRYIYYTGGVRVAALSGHPNILGFYEAIVVITCFAVGLVQKNYLKSLPWLLSGALAIYIVNLTGSRTAFVAAVLGCVIVTILIAFIKSGGKVYFRFAVVLIIGTALILQFMSKDEQSAVSRLFSQSGDTVQYADWRRGVHQKKALGQFADFPIAGDGYQHHARAHNLWLGAIVGGGLLGLAAIIIYQMGMFGCSLSLWLRLNGGSVSPLTLGVMIGIVSVYFAWLAVCIKESYLTHRSIYALLGLMILSSKLLGRPTDHNPQ